MDAIIPIGTVIGWLVILWAVATASPRPRAPHDGPSLDRDARYARSSVGGVKSGASSEHTQL